MNPLLTQFDRALDTSECEYDPILQFDTDNMDFGERDRDRLFKLTCQAICNTYEEIVNHRAMWTKAKLGPEDIRFLNLLRELATASQG